MRKATLAIAALALALIGVSGCANPWSNGGGMASLPGMAKKPEGGMPIHGTPEAYADLSKQQRNRSMVSPALGYEQKPEPGRLARMKNAVTDSSAVKAMTSVFSKSTPTSPQAPAEDPNDPTRLSAKTVPPTAEFHLSVARVHERSGNLKAASEQYRQALAIAPGRLGILLDYARLRDRQGDFSSATALYEMAVKRHPESAAAANDLGLCHARQNQYDKAAAALQKAIQLQPERKLYRNNIATVLVELGRVDEAFEQLAAVHPMAAAHYNLGFLLSQAGQSEAAAGRFELALAADPSMEAAKEWITLLTGESPREPASAGRHASRQRPAHVAAAEPSKVESPAPDDKASADPSRAEPAGPKAPGADSKAARETSDLPIIRGSSRREDQPAEKEPAPTAKSSASDADVADGDSQDAPAPDSLDDFASELESEEDADRESTGYTPPPRY